MKAEEYLTEKILHPESEEKFLAELANIGSKLFLESDEIFKQRNVSTDGGAKAVVRELNQKAKKIAKMIKARASDNQVPSMRGGFMVSHLYPADNWWEVMVENIFFPDILTHGFKW
jgi:hypothetical protein